MVKLGQRLKELRQKHKIGRSEMAKFLGVTERAVSYYESERNKLDIDQLILLANRYDMSLDELVGRKRKGHSD